MDKDRLLTIEEASAILLKYKDQKLPECLAPMIHDYMEEQDTKTASIIAGELEDALENDYVVITQTREVTISPSSLREYIEALKGGANGYEATNSQREARP